MWYNRSMKIKIIAVGKLKEKFWTEASKEYIKRLSAYCDLEIVEVKEYKQQGEGSAAEEKVKEEEGKDILSKIGRSSYVITLEIKGNRLSSPGLAEKINELAISGDRETVFVIGGSLGLSSEVSSRANYKLSFSDMTFPHQMMRVFLLEQIYRSFKIIRKETYHK